MRDIINLWDWDTLFDAFPSIFAAMWLTIGLTFACYAFALVFGIVWTVLRRIPIRPIYWLVTFIMNFIRTTPPLVQLILIYVGLPDVGIILGSITAAILGLGIHFSTYISEIYRSGIESVSKGQWEAATALNYTKFQKWTKIILPQAIPPVIPMLGNYLIIMFKEVPLASAIGVSGMLLMANIYGAKHLEYIEPLTIVAFFFLLMSYPSSLLIKRLEKKMNRRFEKKVGSSDNGKEVTAS